MLPTRSPSRPHPGTKPGSDQLVADDQNPDSGNSVTSDDATARSEHRDWGTTSELYRSSYQTMLRVAYSITGSRAIAEDAVHDAFCTVGPRIGTLQDPVPYLRVAVVNRCRTMHRSNKRAQRHLVQHTVDRAGSEPVDVGLSDFGDALDQLSFPQRTAIVLRYLCDLSDDDIADVLDCRRSTVRSHVRRGLDHLRQELS